MLKEFQNPDTVTSGQGDALMPRHDLFGSGQCSAHNKAREIQTFVRGGCGENAFLFARCADLDAIITRC